MDQSFFDGQKVSIHQGRFTGKFDLDEIDGVTISTGDQVTFMVTVRASSPYYFVFNLDNSSIFCLHLSPQLLRT